jgi:hypothetical protein
MDSVIEWVRANKQLTIVLGAILGIVLVASLLGNLFSGEENDPFVADTTPTSTPDTTPAGPAPNSEVPPVDCGPLITTDEALEALGVPDAGGISEISQREVCHEALSDDESFYVQIGPGSPNDFASGAELIGTTGEIVEGVGDEALWFGGLDAEDSGAYGLVVVHQATQHGELYYRVVLGRPNADEGTQKDITVGLAQAALPRFPGVFIEEEPIEFEVVEFPDEPAPDLSSQGLAENLLSKESAGEWSRGEGLVATLRFMAGEAAIAEIHTGPELVDDSGSLIIELARDYLENGDDEALKTEVQTLIDSLTVNAEDLQSEATGPGLLVSLVPLATEEPNPCDLPDNSSECLDEIPLPSRAGVPDDK